MYVRFIFFRKEYCSASVGHDLCLFVNAFSKTHGRTRSGGRWMNRGNCRDWQERFVDNCLFSDDHLLPLGTCVFRKVVNWVRPEYMLVEELLRATIRSHYKLSLKVVRNAGWLSKLFYFIRNKKLKKDTTLQERMEKSYELQYRCLEPHLWVMQLDSSWIEKIVVKSACFQ